MEKFKNKNKICKKKLKKMEQKDKVWKVQTTLDIQKFVASPA